MTEHKEQEHAVSRLWTRFLGMPGILGLIVVILDQGSKVYFDMNYAIGWSYEVIPGYFNLVHWRNTGAAWGMFAEHTWILGLFSLVCFLALWYWFDSLSGRKVFPAVMLGMLSGGIAGNMLDRLFRGSVIDFLDFHWHGSHYPAFNVADSFICVCMVLLVIWSLVEEHREKKRTRA